MAFQREASEFLMTAIRRNENVKSLSKENLAGISQPQVTLME